MLKTCAIALMCVFVPTMLGGCANAPSDIEIVAKQIQYLNRQPTTAEMQYDKGYQPRKHRVSLYQYAQSIALQLSEFNQPSGRVVVTSFVDFDASLQNTNQLGNQLAESVTIAMQAFGFNLFAINNQGAVSRTPSGNFILSRQQDYLDEGVCCAVSGTMTYKPNGVVINSRLFEIESSQMLATSSVTIPYFLLDDMQISPSKN